MGEEIVFFAVKCQKEKKNSLRHKSPVHFWELAKINQPCMNFNQNKTNK